MTEKRFTYLNASKNHYISSFFCNEVPLTNKEVVDLLNALHEENEEFKSALKELKEIGDYQADRIKELDEENGKLKEDLKIAKIDSAINRMAQRPMRW